MLDLLGVIKISSYKTKNCEITKQNKTKQNITEQNEKNKQKTNTKSIANRCSYPSLGTTRAI